MATAVDVTANGAPSAASVFQDTLDTSVKRVNTTLIGAFQMCLIESSHAPRLLFSSKHEKVEADIPTSSTTYIYYSNVTALSHLL